MIPFAPVIIGIPWPVQRCVSSPVTQRAGPPSAEFGGPASFSNDNRTTLDALRESVRRIEGEGWTDWCDCGDHPFRHVEPRE